MSHYLDELDENFSNVYLKNLKQAWITERGAPELFDYNQDSVDYILDEISKKQDLLDSEKDVILSHIYTLEVDRLKYLVSSYLRTRLAKEDKRYIMSKAEENFAEKCSRLEKQVFDAVLLSNTARPRDYQEQISFPAPNLQVFVYARVAENLGEVDIDGEPMDLTKGLNIVVRYDSIKGWLSSKQIELL